MQWYGSGCPVYNGTRFSQLDVVTVTFNYRLGALGFLSTDSLSGEYGFLDQRLVLEWVQRNIHAFGGDRHRVTLGGQSAGAESVGAHMISPGSQHLFRYAIMESNPLGTPFNTKESAQSIAEIIFNGVGCSITDDHCIRSAPVDAILATYQNISFLLQGNPFSPVVGPGSVIPMQPYIGIMEGLYPEGMKLLNGFNRDEGISLVYPIINAALSSSASYEYVLAKYFGSSASIIAQYYPFTNSTQDGRVLLSEIVMDVAFSCGILNSAQGAIASNPAREVYLYEFMHATDKPIPIRDTVIAPYCADVVCHMEELFFVFDVFGEGAFGYKPKEDERKLARHMNRAWVHFIKTGNPNGKGGDDLLIFDKLDATLSYLHIQAGNSSYYGPFSRYYTCPLWDLSGLLPSPNSPIANPIPSP